LTQKEWFIVALNDDDEEEEPPPDDNDLDELPVAIEVSSR
jgi:hypothetical protein